MLPIEAPSKLSELRGIESQGFGDAVAAKGLEDSDGLFHGVLGDVSVE
jgi:hypothetical protein